MIQLETKRLLIRDYLSEDLVSHHALLSDSRAMYYLQDIQTHSMEESKENLIAAMEEIDRPNRKKYFLRMEDKTTNRYIGSIGYTVTKFTSAGKLVDVGYFTHMECWGKGYVTEALQEVFRFAFEENGVCRISSGCLRENIGSERVMQKCGMVKEGELRQAVWHDGQLKDRVIYRLLKEEYTPIPKKI